MGIKEEVYDEFFRRLKEDERVSVDIIQELKKLFERENISSPEEILEAIQRGQEDDSYD